jgi:hypothetical protein
MILIMGLLKHKDRAKAPGSLHLSQLLAVETQEVNFLPVTKSLGLIFSHLMLPWLRQMTQESGF